MSKDKFTGHLAALGAYAIFGLNIVTTKDIANSAVVSPMVLFTLRAIGASALFWLISLFLPKEKVELKDLGWTVLASFLGLFVPQLTFLKAITMTTPVDTAILGSLTPIFTMFVAAIFIKEPITWKKLLGVALSFDGVLYLILNTVSVNRGVDHTSPWGVVLLLVNTMSFASYLGIFRPLISKYGVVTFMKWMFLFSLMMSLPFSAKGLVTTHYSEISLQVGLEIGFLIVFATCVAYFLIPYGQKRIRPTLVSMYSYVQPVLAVVISVALGMDHFGWKKAIATAFVFAGVLIVNQSRSAASPAQESSSTKELNK